MTWRLFSSLSGDDSHDLDDDELKHGREENDGRNPVPIRTTFELADTLYAEAELGVSFFFFFGSEYAFSQ
jgi:hypothetical protein